MNELEQIKKLVESYLQEQVYNPAREIIEKDNISQLYFPTLLVLVKVTCEQILKKGILYDKELIKNLDELKREKYITILSYFIEKGQCEKETYEIFKEINSKTHLLIYIYREFNWAIISTISANYVSANIILRSVLEFLINISTNNNEGVRQRIQSINFLDDSEKKTLKKYWGNLNAWAHPYSHQEKKICPIYYSFKPSYHKEHCSQSLEYLIVLTDFLITLGLEKYEIPIEIYKDEKIYFPSIFELEFLDKRIKMI